MASTAHSAAAPRAGARRRIDRDVLARSLGAGLTGLAACGIVLGLAWQSGGYFPDAFLKAGCAAFTMLAVALAVRPPAWDLSGPSLLALACLGGLAVWT